MVLLPVFGFPISATRNEVRCALVVDLGDVGSGETMGCEQPGSG